MAKAHWVYKPAGCRCCGGGSWVIDRKSLEYKTYDCDHCRMHCRKRPSCTRPLTSVAVEP